jgi:hypothetical protein
VVTLTSDTLSGNTTQGGQGGNGGNAGICPGGAVGGKGGNGGNALGGGLLVAGGTASMTGDSVSSNAALGGQGGSGGLGSGGRAAGANGSTGQGQGGGICNVVLTTLSNAVDTTTTTLPVADASTIALGAILLIDSEQMQVTAIDTVHNTLTVVRGVKGTTPAAHSANAPIYSSLALDAFTVAHALNNTAMTDPNISGGYLTQ